MRRTSLLALPVVAAALLFSACGVDVPGGTQNIDLPNEDDAAIKRGAVLFTQRCEGCHTLNVVGAQGSSFRVNDREYKDGPNFNSREISYDQVLYAIRNGGFSSGPMPQNIVVGEEAEAVAKFLAKYAGGEVGRAEDAKPGPAGTTGDSPVEEEETTPEGLPEPGATPPAESQDDVDNARPPGQ
jgi:mono/diheme cytochrome c family protein